MGQFSTADTRADGTWTAQYSRELAIAFAQQIETLGLTDASGTALTLAQSGDGVYLAGSYYDHVVSVAEESLNNFLADTTFPYTPSSQTMAGMGTAPEGGSPEAGGEPPSGEMPSGGAPGGEAPGGGAPGGEMPGSTGESTTYESVDDYIAALNESTTWVDYDASTNTARISGLGGFVQSQKNPSKSVGAFDAVDRTQTENVVFGLGEEGRHFDQVSADVIAAHESDFSSLTGWDDAYSAEHYTTDLAEKDSLGVTTIQRAKAYNPMYFLSPSYEGYQSSTVAPNWRIRTGIMQGDTASTTEINLALALGSYGIANVDFATVWGQGHTMAERSGDATENFIAWISERTHA